MLIEIIGFFAALTSTFSLFPQIVKIYKTKSTRDLSYFMLANFLLTSSFWVAYGGLISSQPVLVANVICVISSVWLIQLKWKYD